MSDKPLTYSYTMINQFQNCARAFQARYITRETKFESSPQVEWGNDVHKEAEMCFKENREPTERYAVLTPVIKALKTIPVVIEAEKEIAFDENWKELGWWDKSCRYRGKLDIWANLGGGRAIIGDFKTGKRRLQQMDELRWFSMLAFKQNKDVEQIKNVLLWLKVENGDKPPKPDQEVIDRKQLPELEDKFMDVINKIEHALVYDLFPCKPTGLCPWCSLKTCKHWRPRK